MLRHCCCQGIPLPSANLERLRPICRYVRWEGNVLLRKWTNYSWNEKYTHKYLHNYFANSSKKERQVWKSERTQLGWKLHSHSTSGAEGSCPRHFSNLRIRAYLISTPPRSLHTTAVLKSRLLLSAFCSAQGRSELYGSRNYMMAMTIFITRRVSCLYRKV